MNVKEQKIIKLKTKILEEEDDPPPPPPPISGGVALPLSNEENAQEFPPSKGGFFLIFRVEFFFGTVLKNS